MEYSGVWGKVNYNFKVYHGKNFIKKNNVISVSLFYKRELDQLYADQRIMSLEDVRKDYHVKKRKYNSGLFNLVKKVKDFNVQIFCDNSSFTECQKYLKNPLIQVIKYDFPQFKVKREHFGFFGTLMRFLPLFGLSFDTWENIIVLDLDIYFRFDLFNYFLRQTDKLMFWSRPNYFLSPRVIDSKQRFPIICSLLMQKGNLKPDIFIDYLSNFLLERNEKYERHLRKYLPVDPLERPFMGALEYGTDEYFLNFIYLRKFKKYQVILYREVLGGILEYLRLLRTRKPKLKKEIGLFLEKIVEIFVPMDIPKMKLDEKVIFVMEKIYEENIHKRFRDIDHLINILDLHRFLTKNEEMKKINYYDNLVNGLLLNAEIPHNVFHIYDQNKILQEVFCKK